MNGTPVMLRANITAEEWMALRMIALQTSTPTQDLVAAALRVAYPLNPKDATK